MIVTDLQYISYSTGLYGRKNAGGVTLQLLCERTGEDYYVIFNADIKRKRNFKDKKAGTPLPKGRFSVGRKSAFYKFLNLVMFYLINFLMNYLIQFLALTYKIS